MVLADHIAVEEVADLVRRRQRELLMLGPLGGVFGDDVVAQVDALIADVDRWPSDELLHLPLVFAAEGALQI